MAEHESRGLNALGIAFAAIGVVFFVLDYTTFGIANLAIGLVFGVVAAARKAKGP